MKDIYSNGNMPGLLSVHDSELRYRRLFEAAQDGILILDAASGLIEDVNPFLVKMLGYSREEFVKKKLWEVGAFKDVEANRNAFETLQENEYIRYENLPLKTKDGRMIEVEFVSNVYLAGNEKVIQCNIRDITEHKRIIVALQKNEQKYFNLLNQSSDGIFIIDLSGKILTVNEAMCRELQFSAKEFLSMKIWDIFPGQYLDQYKERLTNILAGESFEKAGEYEVRGKDGRDHYVEILSTPHYNGQDIVGFQGIARDVTARKQAEEALQESEEKYRRLVENLPTIVYMNALGDTVSTLYVSPQIKALMGYSPQEWLADPKLWSKTLHPEDRQNVLKQAELTDQSKEPFEMEYRMIARDGRLVWVHDQIVLVNDLEGKPQFWQGIMLDITERKQAEKALYESEERFKNAFQYSAVGMALVSLEGQWLKVNSQFCSMVGYSEDELLTKTFQDITHPDDLNTDIDNVNQLLAGEIKFYKMEKRYLHKDGRIIWTFLAVALARDKAGAPLYFISQIEDITVRKQAEEALARSEKEFRYLAENAPVGIFRKTVKGKLLYVNDSFARMFGFDSPLEVMQMESISHYKTPADLDTVLEITQKEGSIKNYEIDMLMKSGEPRNILLSATVEKDVLTSMIIDITERKQAEVALKASESRFRSYNEFAPLGVFIVDQTGRYVEVNAAATKMLGYTEAELLSLSITDVLAPQSLEAGVQQFQTVVQEGTATAEFLFRRKDGTQFWATVLAVKLGAGRFMSYCQDITERKQAEQGLRSGREFLQSVQDALSTHIAILDYESNIVQVNSAWRDFGAKNGLVNSNHCIGMNYLEVCDSAKGPDAREAGLVAEAIRAVRSGGKNEEWVEYPCHSPDEQRWFVARITSFENNGQKWIVVAHENISERKHAEARIRRQLEHLTALSAIDRVIAGNFDLKVSLSEILTHVTAELGVDAADILILNPYSQMLEFGAERGFRTKVVRKTQVRLGESFAGRAALERKLVQIPNLRIETDNFFLKTQLPDDDFVCYFGVPLIAKGQVKGVLEVFHGSALEPEAEWLDFLNVLAGQTAIAIDNSTMFESLQRSNLDLTMAYDATIEGWSRALDLRDKETEGHTQRVTEVTVKLARTFGLSEAELVHVRWGALLHDIGKMGVPDRILLKPGPLTDEEWLLMKQHPDFAYEMLSPIRYLRHSLDIPYSHHEKWDGTGYPRGLKNTQIPLVARIFAVVDVWDALRSDRPYRPAWTVEKVREHIRASSGTHLDPQVVAVFLQMDE